MEQAKLDRINELARLKKQRPLTEAETAEQQKLREEYIAEWREGARRVLDNTWVQYPDGRKEKLKKKENNE